MPDCHRTSDATENRSSGSLEDESQSCHQSVLQRSDHWSFRPASLRFQRYQVNVTFGRAASSFWMEREMKLTIVAATGGIGRQALELAVAAGHERTAVRPGPEEVSRDVRVGADEFVGPGPARLRGCRPGARQRPSA